MAPPTGKRGTIRTEAVCGCFVVRGPKHDDEPTKGSAEVIKSRVSCSRAITNNANPPPGGVLCVMNDVIGSDLSPLGGDEYSSDQLLADSVMLCLFLVFAEVFIPSQHFWYREFSSKSAPHPFLFTTFSSISTLSSVASSFVCWSFRMSPTSCAVIMSSSSVLISWSFPISFQIVLTISSPPLGLSDLLPEGFGLITSFAVRVLFQDFS